MASDTRLFEMLMGLKDRDLARFAEVCRAVGFCCDSSGTPAATLSGKASHDAKLRARLYLLLD